MKKRSKIIIWIVILILIVFAAIKLFKGSSGTADAGQNQLVQNGNTGGYFLTYRVEKKEIPDAVELFGSVDADIYKITSKMNEEIEQVYVKQGDTVKVGDPLVRLSETGLRSKYLAAYRDYESSLSGAPIDVQQKKIDLDLAKKNLDNVIIKSPANGTVKSVSAKVGEYSSQSSELVSIVDTSSLIAKASIDELDIPVIKKGNKVIIEFSSLNVKISGYISYVSPSAANSGGMVSVPVEISFDEDASKYGVISGMSCKIKVLLMHKQNILVVPVRAVYSDDSGEYLLVMDEKGVKQKVYIKTGERTVNVVEILEGIKEGTEIIIEESPDVPVPENLGKGYYASVCKQGGYDACNRV